MATVCVIQHVACETPGLIAEVLKSAGVEVKWVRPYRGEKVPRELGRHDGLLVMGGPMGVYEEDRYPFLRQELRLIEDALRRRRPVLGICLGSQLLATALGATVRPGRQKEIGWHSVTLGCAAAQDDLWRDAPPTFTAFHWHGDGFNLPRGTTRLAWSEITECQAFRYDAVAYGLLFHAEVTEPIIQRMIKTFRRELLDSGINPRQLRRDVEPHLAPLQEIGRTVFGRWAALV